MPVFSRRLPEPGHALLRLSELDAAADGLTLDPAPRGLGTHRR